jgi:hypothetical protein
LAARTSILLNLADSPRPVTSHSRVVDVERAMDRMEERIGELLRKLVPTKAGHSPQSSRRL